jgi:hypothetical protein
MDIASITKRQVVVNPKLLLRKRCFGFCLLQQPSSSAIVHARTAKRRKEIMTTTMYLLTMDAVIAIDNNSYLKSVHQSILYDLLDFIWK